MCRSSSRIESTNSRQAAFVVNRKAVESTNDIQNITFGLKLTKVMESVMPLMRVILVVQKLGLGIMKWYLMENFNRIRRMRQSCTKANGP